MRDELRQGENDRHTEHIIVAYIHIALELIARYYSAQMTSSQPMSADILTRFENLLRRYYRDGLQQERGLPSVKYCAQELFLSPNYFGDLVKQLTGDTATSTIRRFVMQRAETLLIAGHTITQTAEALGFDYPQHFTRQFKAFYGVTPTTFRKRRFQAQPE